MRLEAAEIAWAKETHVQREREKAEFRVRPEAAEIASGKEPHRHREKTMADASSSRQGEGAKVDVGVGEILRAEDEKPTEVRAMCHSCKGIGVLVERFQRRSYYRKVTNHGAWSC